PLAKRFRTGLLLGMYSLVVFVLVMLSTMSNMFSAQGPRMTDDERAGYDVVVDSNPANPPTAAQLEAQPDVQEATLLTQGFPEFFVEGFTDEPETWVMSGFSDGLLARGTPKLSDRDAGYGTDEEAWRAVLADPSLAVIPEFFLQEGGPPEGSVDAGDTFMVINPVDGREHTLTAAGIIEGDWVFNGVLVGNAGIDEYAGRVAASRAYVAVEPGADPDAVAEALTANMIPNGADAETFAAIVHAGIAENDRFFLLLEGFLALGLAIGIAGLGVVMVRAVRERRRQIGMLRAMGFQARTVRAAFLIESAFIAVQGIAIGVSLGLIVAWSLLSNSSTFGDDPIPFQVPWLALTVLGVTALGASMLAVYAPSAQASRIKPAVALRIAD
ncbi:MAG: ABC transporter permease, partial [Acidimicrobiales bacterium]